MPHVVLRRVLGWDLVVDAGQGMLAGTGQGQLQRVLGRVQSGWR